MTQSRPPGRLSPEKIDRLQILRAFAAFLVVADHAVPFVLPRFADPEAGAKIAAELGNYGVSIFFVISGYIMVHTSSSLFGGWSGAWQFVHRRAARIVPLYWIFTAIAILLSLSKGQPISASQLTTSLLFIAVSNADGGPMRPLVGQGWTLNYEIFFYALFAACLLLDRHWALRVFTASMVVLVSLGYLFTPPLAAGLAATASEFYTDPQLLQFAGGVLIGAFFARPQISQIEIPQLGPIIAGTTCVLLVAAGFAIEISGMAPTDGIAYRLVVTVIAALCVFLCLGGRDDRRSRLRRGLVALGEASYSIYLAHGFGIIAVAYWLSPQTTPIWLFLLVASAAAVAVGLVVHQCIEVPIAALLRRKPRATHMPTFVGDVPREAS